MKKYLKLVVIISFIIVCYIFFYLNSTTNNVEKLISIKRGDSVNNIITILEKEQLIKNKLLFKIVILFRTKNKNTIKYGEYVFENKITHLQIINKLIKGKNFLRNITFSEGLTNNTMLKIINENKDLIGEIDSKIIPEGTLFPETYAYQKSDKRQDIVNRMQKNLFDNLKNEWEKRDDDLPYKNMKEALIMASIIEKETGIEEERKLVASVFINRLKIDMPLQTDPTSIYGHTRGDVNKEKEKRVYILLRENSPYNTYKNKGLPPTPICNPGLKSIQAALHPAKTNYLFFVAIGGGRHVFAETYNEHIKNIEKSKKIKH